MRDEIDRRKRRLGILSYDDLLTRLADALEADDSPARQRMRQRWKIVLVDEFQDTDPVQWKVLDRAFSGQCHAGADRRPEAGDLRLPRRRHLHLPRGRRHRRHPAHAGHQLAQRRALVDALQALPGGAALGDPRDRACTPSRPTTGGSRLAGAPVADPLRLRVVRPPTSRPASDGTVPIDALARTSPQDLADDVARLLASGATFDGEPVGRRRRRAS